MSLKLEAVEAGGELVAAGGDALVRLDGSLRDLARAARPAGPLFPARDGKLVWLTVEPAAVEQCVLAVEFRSAGGRGWNAVGGGATVAAAILDARESCPEDASWEPVSWSDLYGD